MTEDTIIDTAHTLLEQDADDWATTDDEWTTARRFLNLGVGRWEQYENTTWRELWVMNSDASSALGGDTLTVASTWDYDCPSDMERPGGYVTTGTSTHTFWTVIPAESVQMYANSDAYFCYFTGSKKTGFDLHFNPRVTITADQAIDYPYYKQASTSSATSFVPEMSDPYYLAYFIAAHMSEEGVNADFFNMAEDKLENMRVKNMSGLWGTPDTIEDDGNGGIGFGSGGPRMATSTNPIAR